MKTLLIKGLIAASVMIFLNETVATAQQRDFILHQRGKLWEAVWNYGFFGDPGAWDFLSNKPKGLYPGFPEYYHTSTGNEQDAVGVFANANNHNFRGGTWIVAKDVMVPGAPPEYTPRKEPFELFHVGNEAYGIEEDRPDIVLTKNYLESEDYNPSLPEEISYSTYETNLGLSVTQRTYAWGFPEYDDFIIYDFTFKNTGRMVSTDVGRLVPNPEDFQQTLTGVYFLFETAVSVSTKSQINFYNHLDCVQAGAFGWKEQTYHDKYYVSTDQTLTASYNVNGGYEPPENNCGYIKENEQWKRFFGDELQSPSVFGRLALYASPRTPGAERSSPRPDIRRIDSHKGGTFKDKNLDHEFFAFSGGWKLPKKQFYDFAQEATDQPGLGNNGDRFNFFFHNYGPYTIAPGDSVRFVFAEIAGSMDLKKASEGDVAAFPQESIDAIEHNAEMARNAVLWGLGATVNGIPLAADVPEPPPAPVTNAANASVGSEKAVIAVTWDNLAESAAIRDNSGSVFYNGLEDIDGYRIYRSQDFQYNPGNPGKPTFRGAWWDLIKDIPKSEFSQYWDPELNAYKFNDEDVVFGFQYGYYVAAYNNDPRSWTSANGTVVPNVGAMESGPYNHSEPTSAAVGPVASFDIHVVPNPYVFGDAQRSFGLSDPYRIEFRNLPERALIRIYTVSGDLVKSIDHKPDAVGNQFGTATWDQRSDSGLLVAPGVYIFYIESESEMVSDKMTGKLVIVR